MNDLICIGEAEVLIKEYNGQRVVTFKDIDTVHQRPSGTANKRFIDNKKRFIEGEDYFTVSSSEIRKTHIFPISDNDFKDKTLITESGYLMLVKSFTDDLAWEVQRQLVKSYFKQSKPMTTAEKIHLLAQSDEELTHRVDEVEAKVEELEETMPLLAVDCDRITNAVKAKGVETLGGKDSNSYKDRSLRGRVYADIHREVKRQFGVTTYKAIKRNQCEKAVAFVRNYNVPFVLQEQIAENNAQLNLEVTA